MPDRLGMGGGKRSGDSPPGFCVASGGGLRHPALVKVIEEQLLSMFRDLPVETDCSVSVKVLESLGLQGRDEQKSWLAAQRPAAGARGWHHTGEHWLYSGSPDEGELRKGTYSFPVRSPAAAPPKVARSVLPLSTPRRELGPPGR